MVEVTVVSPKGQITIPSKLRKALKINKGEKLLIFQEKDAIKLIPIPKLSNLAGVDKEIFKGRSPSKEIEALRKEWSKEFEERIQ